MVGKNYISRYLEDLIPVAFELETAKEFMAFGIGPAQFKVKLNGQIPKRELMRSTSLALGEAYMRGDLEVNRDLYEVLEMLLGRMDRFRTSPGALHGRKNGSLGMKNQKKEVCSHYDIGNDFYRLWLDETMSYSCGYFKNPEDTLFEAQVSKTDHILQKLQPKMGMTLLDIGCGWGFLLMRAAKRYGVKGVGITLSEEQYRQFSQEIKDQHMEDRIEVRKMDYRELSGSGMKFDRVVSVGMVEHVGRGNYDIFLENVAEVLEPGGLFLLHFISAQKEHGGDPFMRKYIFPGGVIPSLREIMDLLPEYDFYTLDVESLRRHYTRTLLCWRENFSKHREEIETGHGEEFARMWELYLASCAASFHNGVVDLHQILMSKGVNNELPMVRMV
ncbi:MAG: class I SAM-dependent methyltransferase [Lachnospiraceae bacterium]|nr:class I SAM-dependent methyltransferase [Lachnospiraceae bacterium]